MILSPDSVNSRILRLDYSIAVVANAFDLRCLYYGTKRIHKLQSNIDENYKRNSNPPNEKMLLMTKFSYQLSTSLSLNSLVLFLTVTSVTPAAAAIFD